MQAAIPAHDASNADVNVQSSLQTRHAAWKGAFIVPAFRWFAGAQAIAFTVLIAQIIVRSWMVQVETGSPFLVSLVPSLHLLPSLVLGFAGGELADRFDRRKVVFWGEVINFGAFGSLAVLALMGAATAWTVLATTGLIGISYALASPSRQALIVDTVPRAIERRAIGSYMLVMHVTLLTAPALAGGLIAAFDVATALTVTAILCCLPLPIYLLLKLQPFLAPMRRTGSMFRSLREGVGHIAANPSLRWMFAVLLVSVLFVNTWGAMFAPIAEQVLHRGAAGLSAITLAVGIGAILGAIGSIAMEGRVSDRTQQLVFGMAFSLLIVAVALSPVFELTLVLTVITSAAGAPFFINNMVASQAETEERFRARVVSVRYVVLAAQPIGMIALGAAAEAVGPQFALAGSTAIGAVLLLAVFAVLARTRRAGAGQPALESVTPTFVQAAD